MPQVFNGLSDYHLIMLLAYEDNKREIYTEAAEAHRNIQMVSCASTFICRGETKIKKVRLGILPVKGNRFYISAHDKPLKTSGDLLLWGRGSSMPVHTLPTGTRNVLGRENQCTHIVLIFISRYKTLLHE